MTPLLRNFVAGLASAATLLLAGCGGGGGGSSPATATPTAVATASPATVPIGTAVTLDASGSTGPSGTTLSYQWSLPTRPQGSTATLSNATEAKPSFTPDVAGTYVAELTVSTGQASAAARVTVTATTDVPTSVIANASQSVLLGSTVVLDGSGSLPPTGGAASGLGYQWRLTEQPAGDPATVLDGATNAKASFTANKTGIYRATLVVTHGGKSSAAAQAEIRVGTGNSAPVAKASAPATVVRGTTVTLDGTGSTDPDGDTLHYRWNFPPYNTSGGNSSNEPPLANTAVIRNADSARAEFTPDAVGNYDVILTVYDGSVSASQKITIAVTKPAGAANVPPVAVIGSGAASYECEMGGYCGISSYRSYDADGDARTYQWTYWNTATPGNTQTVAGSGLYAISTAAAGTWHVELVANDGQAESAPVTQTLIVKTGANVAPVTKVAVDTATVVVGQTIAFDGSGTTDANGDQISYQWTLIDRPDGSSAVLQNAAAVRATVVADRPGIYRARLIATDSRGATNVLGPQNYGSVFAKAVNNAPVVANFQISNRLASTPTAEQPLVIQTANYDSSTGTTWTGLAPSFTATLFDPDLDAPLYYILTATRFPAGSTFTPSLAGQTYASFQGGQISDLGPFRLTLPGEYEFQLLASDGTAYSDPKTLNFSVVKRENYPGILLEVVNAPYSNQILWPVYNLREGLLLSNEDDAIPRNLGSTYRLYAADRDYTITDLVASSTDGSLKPSINGLSNGQVIHQGESVTFTATRPAIPNERDLSNGLISILSQYGVNSDEYKNEAARLAGLYDAYRFTWSFRIAEKANHTFYIGPAQ